jgi:hypothetical protein
MGPLSKFWKLSLTDKLLLVEALFLLGLAQVGLRTLPFATLRVVLTKISRVAARKSALTNTSAERRRIIWAVEAVGQHFPAIGTCLTQALAAYVLLRRRGHETNLRIGVSRDQAGKFAAHAWLEQEGAILIGEAWSKKYTPMPALNGLEP